MLKAPEEIARRGEAYGVLHVKVTEALMEFRRSLRLPRRHALPAPAAGAGEEPAGAGDHSIT